MSYRIGNTPAIMEALCKQARAEGNESEHELGVAIINLARERGLTEDAIIDASMTQDVTQDGPVFYYP